MPSESTVLVHDSSHNVSIHTRTGTLPQAVGADVSLEKAIKKLLKKCPPSTIDAVYILLGDAPYTVMKRTLAAYKNAKYSNIKLIDGHSYLATEMICGCDFEYKEGETILCYDHYGGSIETGISMVLKKVDELFQIIDHIGQTIHDILYHYPEIDKIIIKTNDKSIAWNTVFGDKVIRISQPPYILPDFIFKKLRRVEQITRIKMVLKYAYTSHSLDLYYETVPVTKTVELLLIPEISEIEVWVSRGAKEYLKEGVHKLSNKRPGYATKLAVTVTIDETIIPKFFFEIIDYIPQVIHEIVYDSTDNKFFGNLIKRDSQETVITGCTTPEDVFAAFQSMPITNYQVGTIINYKNKFNIDVNKTIMKLLIPDRRVCIIPLQTALFVDIIHAGLEPLDDECIAIWYQYTNSEMFYMIGSGKPGKVGFEKHVDERMIKKVLVVTENALSIEMIQKMQGRFPAAKIYHSNRATLTPRIQYEYVWFFFKEIFHGYNVSPSLGLDFVIAGTDSTVNIDKKVDLEISHWAQVVPIGKTEGIITVDMKHYALPYLVRLQEVEYGSSKNNREAVIRLSVDQHYIHHVVTTLQKTTSQNAEKNNPVIHTITPELHDYVVKTIYQTRIEKKTISLTKGFQALANYMVTLAPVSSVIAVIDFTGNDMSLAEGKQRRDILLAVGFTKVVPWSFSLMIFEFSSVFPVIGECIAIFATDVNQIFVRQGDNLKCVANIEVKKNIIIAQLRVDTGRLVSTLTEGVDGLKFQFDHRYFDKFKVNMVNMSDSVVTEYPSPYEKAPPRRRVVFLGGTLAHSSMWNAYWNIANGKSYLLPFIALEFIVKGTNLMVFKTGTVSLPHEFTAEIDVETANSIKVFATESPSSNSKKEEPMYIATHDTRSFQNRTIAITISIENAYNITAKFKASAPGHKKRVVTRIVVMKQSENGVNRLTFSRGGKSIITDDLPSMLVALETHAHPELSCVIFATSKAHLVKCQRYIELAQRFRFADIQVCHESVLEANKLLYGSDIDAEIDETMFIISSTKYFKNFNKSYVIRKESNRFKLLKEDADTIENLRKEFPDVERITYEGLNPINKNDAPGSSSLQAYLFNRIDGTLRETAVADIEMDAKLATTPLLEPVVPSNSDKCEAFPDLLTETPTVGQSQWKTTSYESFEESDEEDSGPKVIALDSRGQIHSFTGADASAVINHHLFKK